MSALVEHEALLRATYYTPGTLHKTARTSDGKRVRNWGAPGGVLLWGPPGGGKTSALERLADRVGGACFILDSTMGEGGLGATPVPDIERAVLRFLRADYFECFDESPGVFGVDDMTTFPPALQPYLLGMLLNKRVGSHYLPPNVRVYGAANEPLDAPGGWDLAAAVANRCCHIEYPDAPIEDWCSGLSTFFDFHDDPIDSAKEEKRVLQAWPSAYARAAGLMTGFSMAKRELHRFKTDPNSPTASKAFYTPRTKAFAAIALASSYVHNLNDVTADVFVAGYVGEAFASEWSTWRKQQDLPDAAKVLDEEDTFEHNKYRIDRTAAFMHSCCSLLEPTSCPKRRERTKAFWSILDFIASDALDSVAQVVISRLYKADLVQGYPEAKPVLKKLRPMLDATEQAQKAS
jgi:hypothetical protein